MMDRSTTKDVDLEAVLRPETQLERQLLADPEFREGLLWGAPRYGHPEGEVYKHVREVLDNIDKLSISDSDRLRLRLVAFVHDTYKHAEDKSIPRKWSRHHAVLARRFLETYTDDEIVLQITQWHDEAYYVWRDFYVYQFTEQAEARMERLLTKLGDFRQLYYLFFVCDTLTGDKNLAPLRWVNAHFPGIDPVKLPRE